ncbi:MAG: hypothetical protein KAI72_07590, partial [Candidatus Pacebacteria bacterium]|nr:hypothetical protein [Candidatus Paceibacterota bacterium]
MQKTFWDGLKQQYQFHSTPTLELIAGFIIANKCKRVFEASCGTGYFIKILRDAGYGDKFLGTDYCDCFIESASQNNPKDVFAKIDLSEK